MSLEDPNVSWPKEKNRPSPYLPEGKTFPEAFLKSCKRMGSFAAICDDLTGFWNYKKLKKSVLILSQYFRGLPDERIAVMLPSSAATIVVIAAIQFAGKTPVMLSWVLGIHYLKQMMLISRVKTIISSSSLIEKLSHLDFSDLKESILTIEGIKRKIGINNKIKGQVLCFFGNNLILRVLKLNNKNENEPAVIVFTSGSEGMPKGVPLSHHNILTNMHSFLSCFKVFADDVYLGFLPFFHTTGLTVGGFLYLFSGMKLCLLSNPWDTTKILNKLIKWKVTIFGSAVYFLGEILDKAKPEEFSNIRYVMVGSEKTPEKLFKQVESLKTGTKLLEGYGASECSPMIACNREDQPRKGVGPVLPEIEFCTIHPETHKLLDEGAEGEICLRGPSIFNGYLGNTSSPFIELQGKPWYRTGDLGFRDSEGNIFISGRLKRWVKIEGQMVSLAAIEEVLTNELSKQGLISSSESSLGISSYEIDRKKFLVLFVTFEITKEFINEILARSGFSNLIRISLIQKINKMPLTTLGKIDYPSLEKLLSKVQDS